MSFYKYLKIQEVIKDLNTLSYKIIRLPRWINGKKKKKIPLPSRRCRFDPWVGKIPWGRKWQPPPERSQSIGQD